MKKDEPDVFKVTHASIVVHTVKIPGSVGTFVERSVVLIQRMQLDTMVLQLQ